MARGIFDLAIGVLRSQSFSHFDRGCELNIPSLLQFCSRKFDCKLWLDAIVLNHPSLPCQVSGNREPKNVSVADLVCAAAKESAGSLRSHDGCQTIFLRES